MKSFCLVVALLLLVGCNSNHKATTKLVPIDELNQNSSAKTAEKEDESIGIGESSASPDSIGISIASNLYPAETSNFAINFSAEPKTSTNGKSHRFEVAGAENRQSVEVRELDRATQEIFNKSNEGGLSEAMDRKVDLPASSLIVDTFPAKWQGRPSREWAYIYENESGKAAAQGHKEAGETRCIEDPSKSKSEGYWTEK